MLHPIQNDKLPNSSRDIYGAVIDPSDRSADIANSRRYTVRVFSTAAEMETLRPFWEAMNQNPNAQIDFYHLINETRDNILKPYVMVLERRGEPCGLVIGRIVSQQFKCHLGYRTISLGKVTELDITFGGILGCESEECADIVLSQFQRLLNQHEVDFVLLSHLNTNSCLFNFSKRRPGFLSRDWLVVPQLHWKTKLPATQAEFLNRLNKKHRYWLRRLEKQVESDFPGQINYRCFTNCLQLDEVMSDLESIASKTYQRQLSAGFRNDNEFRERVALEAEKGWLRVYVLYLGSRPCAFWLGTLYKGVFHSGCTGYDPEYRKYEVGTLVFMKMLEQLCIERAEVIDYGLGDALYKQRFGDESWREASVRIFSPSLRGIALNVAQTSIQTPGLCIKWFLNRTNLQQRIKTLWRKRLVKDGKMTR